MPAKGQGFKYLYREDGMSGDVIGFVGVGRMGAPMVGRLMDAGHKLVVFDTLGSATKPLVDLSLIHI